MAQNAVGQLIARVTLKLRVTLMKLEFLVIKERFLR